MAVHTCASLLLKAPLLLGIIYSTHLVVETYTGHRSNHGPLNLPRSLAAQDGRQVRTVLCHLPLRRDTEGSNESMLKQVIRVRSANQQAIPEIIHYPFTCTV